jgi:hypothetical protein
MIEGFVNQAIREAGSKSLVNHEVGKMNGIDGAFTPPTGILPAKMETRTE